jgi:protein-S-isoprenylcysteine O-methyltransferase Ste14
MSGRTVASVVELTCWITFVVVWLLGAAYNARRGPQVRTRYNRWYGWVVVAVAVVYLDRHATPSVWRPLTINLTVGRSIGLPLLVLATAFTIWARIRLGTMWSSTAVAKQDHQLRTDGPYAITRHPIYTGLLGMVLASVLSGGIGDMLVVLVLAAVLVWLKIRAEERLMTQTFPEDYPAYRRRVPALIPGLRVRRPKF